jgi:hypothetical protein
MRDLCLVIDAVSAEAADRIGVALREQQLDLEVEAREARVLCFAASEPAIRGISRDVRQTLEGASLWKGAVKFGHLRVWSDDEHRYVDPEHPGENLYGSDLDPDEIRWRVRLELTSVFESRRVRKALPRFEQRVIGTGPRHIDLGAADEGDAEEIARAARALEGVTSATPSELGRRQRWWLSQRRSGNYGVQPPDGSWGGGF